MRPVDWERINEPYTPEELAIASPARRLARRLGVEAPAATELAELLFADLSEVDHGFAWWAHVPFRRRVLISDYMCESASAIESALLDAKIHHLEIIGATDGIGARFRRPSAGHTPERMRSVRPEDEIPDQLADLHSAGFFRAAGSILDCLAAVVVGVAAIPIPVVKASWHGVREYLASVAKKGAGEGRHPELVGFAVRFEDMAGRRPQDWLEWTIAMRNMYVHRPRQMAMRQMTTRASGLYLPRAVVADSIRFPALLPRHPNLTTIDAMRVAQGEPHEALLRESEETTRAGVLESVTLLANAGAELLADLWRFRRSEPAAIAQPAAKQWPSLQPPRDVSFPGYDPGSMTLKGPQMRVNPSDARRFRAGAVFDKDLPKWEADEEDGGVS